MRLLEAAAVVDRVGLGDRNAEAHRKTQRMRAVLRDREALSIERLVVNFGRAGNAVDGPVRLEIRR